MDKIILIKTNNCIDIIESDIEISNDYISIDELLIQTEDFDNCILELYNIKIKYDSGQEGEYGRWEIAPYYYFDKLEIKKLCDLKSYKTTSEKKQIRYNKLLKKKEKLQLYVEKFNTNNIKYSLCSLYGIDKLALRTVEGETFQIYKTILEFDNSKLTYKNLSDIKKQIDNYFNLKQENGITK